MSYQGADYINNNDIRTKRLRRCPLSVPGSSSKMLARAAVLDCDAVILDLEDSVAPNAKSEARQQIIAAMMTFDWRPKTISLRINAVDTSWCHDDIIDVVSAAGSKLDTIVLAKARTAHDVMFAHLLLDQLESKLGLNRRIGIECLIEDVEGMMNVEQIAGCSDRLESLIFGMGDYAASQGMNVQRVGESSSLYPADLWHYPRYKMIIACRVHGLDPIDGPYADFRDLQGFRVDCQQADLLGMAGKWAIHPDQIAVGNESFSPSAAVVASARKQKAAYLQALAAGQGAINVDGVMVDAASIRLQQNILERADLIGMP